MSSSDNFVSPLATMSYVNLWQARGFKNTDGTVGDPEFSVTLVIPKTTDMSVIDAQFNKVLAADFPDGMPYNSRTGKGVNEVGAYMDGAIRYPNDPFYADKWIMGSSQKEDRFSLDSIMDAQQNPIMDKSQIYSGAIGHALISFYGYQGGSKGIGCSLHGVMKISDGEAMGGGAVDAKAGFASAGVGGGQTPPPAASQAPPPAASQTPPPQAPPAAPTAPPAYVMTAKANGATYEQMLEAKWSHEQMVAGGMIQQ